MNQSKLSDSGHKWSRRFAVVGCAAVVSIATLAAADAVKSQWRTPDARVDGLITDWKTLTSVTKEITVGAVNDGTWLHLAISASDTATRQQLMTSGLNVYLDAAGKKSKSFGVRIPPLQPSRGFGSGRRGSGALGDPIDLPAPARDVRSGLTYVEIIGPERDQVHIVDVTNEGSRVIEAATGDNAGTFLIELALPLRPIDQHPYSLNLSATQRIIGLGLVTPERTAGRGGAPGGGMPGGGMGGGSMGGRGGGMPGRGGMGGQGTDGPAGKALNTWTTIELAREADR